MEEGGICKPAVSFGRCSGTDRGNGNTAVTYSQPIQVNLKGKHTLGSASLPVMANLNHPLPALMGHQLVLKAD